MTGCAQEACAAGSARGFAGHSCVGSRGSRSPEQAANFGRILSGDYAFLTCVRRRACGRKAGVVFCGVYAVLRSVRGLVIDRSAAAVLSGDYAAEGSLSAGRSGGFRGQWSRNKGRNRCALDVRWIFGFFGDVRWIYPVISNGCEILRLGILG